MVQTKKYLIKVGNDFNSSIILESDDIKECEKCIQEYKKENKASLLFKNTRS